MTPFIRAEGPVFTLAIDNIDTDQIIPARFMTRPRSAGYGDVLLHDLRHDPEGRPAPGFEGLAGAMFLVAGANFGCGSSREAAVYALADAGIRAVLAPGFADIFRTNALKNGLLPITLPPEGHARAASAPRLEVDLEACEVRLEDGGPALNFSLPAVARRRILQGLDEIADTLTCRHQIEAHEAAVRAARPWALPTI